MNMAQNEQATLLLVDDDHTFCMVLGQALEKRGFSVTVASLFDSRTFENALALATFTPMSALRLHSPTIWPV